MSLRCSFIFILFQITFSISDSKAQMRTVFCLGEQKSYNGLFAIFSLVHVSPFIPLSSSLNGAMEANSTSIKGMSVNHSDDEIWILSVNESVARKFFDVRYGHSSELCHLFGFSLGHSSRHRGRLHLLHLHWPSTGTKHSTQTICCCLEGPITNGSSHMISSRGFISLVATTTLPFCLENDILYGRHFVLVEELETKDAEEEEEEM